MLVATSKYYTQALLKDEEFEAHDECVGAATDRFGAIGYRLGGQIRLTDSWLLDLSGQDAHAAILGITYWPVYLRSWKERHSTGIANSCFSCCAFRPELAFKKATEVDDGQYRYARAGSAVD